MLWLSPNLFRSPSLRLCFAARVGYHNSDPAQFAGIIPSKANGHVRPHP
jgi:hypothetical protein